MLQHRHGVIHSHIKYFLFKNLKMRQLILLLLTFLSINIFGQGVQENIVINPNQSKNVQYIGISSNGRDILSTRKHKMRPHETKGHFYSERLVDFADALSDYIGLDISQTAIDYADTTFVFIEDAVTYDSVNTLIAESGGGLIYQVYTALLSQTGTSAPTATVLENTLGVTPTFGYGSVGNYTITIAGEFNEAKTFYTLQQANDAWNGSVVRSSIDLDPADGKFYIFTANSSDVGVNSWGATLCLKIEVYP